MDDDLPILDGYNVCLRKTRQGSECSMNSQRLEEIVSALMKPIKDMKQNFDMDLNSLLEEYLTEAGLRQLNGLRDEVLPNFSEVALLLQQSANIYSKKVDYLWQQVREIVRSFGSEDCDAIEEGDTENRKKQGRTKRKTELLNFELIDLEEATNINLKEVTESKPLPILPKTFIQFEPRIISENDVQIKDYNGVLIGVATDFRCNWNTDINGTLCDDLDFCPDKETPSTFTNIDSETESPTDSGHCSDYTDGAVSDTPINLPSETECHSGPDVMSPTSETEYPSMLADETSASLLDETHLSVLPEETPVVELQSKETKKRKLTDGSTPVKAKNSKYDMEKPFSGTAAILNLQNCCFSLPASMIAKVVERRKNKLKKLRRKMNKLDCNHFDLSTDYLLDTFVLKLESKAAISWHRKEILRCLKVLSTDWEKDFLGFPEEPSKFSEIDIAGFRGFTCAEYESTYKRYSHRRSLYSAVLGTDINTCKRTFEDDGCHSDDDGDNRDYPNLDYNQEKENSIIERLNSKASDNQALQCSKEQLEISQRVQEWHNSIHANLLKAERRKDFDVWAYGSQVLMAFKSNHGDSAPSANISFRDVVRNKPKEDIARYFLSTLMLANTLNVEIIKTDPLECKDFKLRLLSLERCNNDSL